MSPEYHHTPDEEVLRREAATEIVHEERYENVADTSPLPESARRLDSLARERRDDRFNAKGGPKRGAQKSRYKTERKPWARK